MPKTILHQLKIKLKVWRQSDKESKGSFKKYDMNEVNEHMSFLEMLDVLNEDLTQKGEEPIAFSHDCREGICGSCGVVINGQPHGPERGTATCQLHMRKFKSGDSITVEPWRAKAFPVLKDLVVDRSAFDRIQQAGGYITVNTGSAPEANLTPIPKPVADEAFLAAACIGCGACVAACKNASAMLFVAAKVSHLALMPQGKAGRRAGDPLQSAPCGRGSRRTITGCSCSTTWSSRARSAPTCRGMVPGRC